MASITRELAQFVVRTDTLPAPIRHMARLCLLDWCGAAIAGSAEPIAAPLLQTLQLVDARADATVLGTPLRASAPWAALVNGSFSHVLELDDVHLPAAIHGSATVWAATLAVAEQTGAPAEAATLAFAVGYEVMARIGVLAGQRMIRENHHPTGVLGYFGAAAAAGRLLGLDAERQTMAFGIAAGQAGGSTQVRGTMSKPYFAGHAAHGGVVSALLAAQGFVSAADCFEGAQGILATYAPGADMAAAVDGLGRRWELAENAFKVHGSCAMSHAIVDGILALRARHGLLASEVAALRLYVFPHAAEYLDRPQVDNGLQGKFSAQYCAAVALLDGIVQENQFSAARAGDAALREVMARVTLEPDDRWRMDQARVEIHLHNGECHALEVLAVSGSPAKPIGDAAMEAKFLQLARRALPAARAEQLLRALRAWPRGSVRGLLDLAATAT